MATLRHLEKGARSQPAKEIVEILLRLPAKDLARYKCVCKPWLSLISSPLFISSHLKRSISDPSSHCVLIHFACPLRGTPRQPGPLKSVTFCLFPETIFVGSINGLICVVGRCDGIRGPSPDDIWIWNPLTGHSKKLPLGRHTSPINVTFAFCWDSVADDYKVVKIVSNPEKETLSEVWASSSDCWREIRVYGHFYHPHFVNDVTYCDAVVEGFPYWIVVNPDDGNLFVASFDMRTDVMKLISIPELSIPREFLVECLTEKHRFFFGTNWKGNFALVEIDLDSLNHCHLWTMDGGVGKEVWTKKLSLNLDILFFHCMSSINGKLVLKGSGDGAVTLYDLETQEAQSFGDPKLSAYVSSAYDYVGSLVSIKGFEPLGDDISRTIDVIWPPS